MDFRRSDGSPPADGAIVSHLTVAGLILYVVVGVSRVAAGCEHIFADLAAR